MVRLKQGDGIGDSHLFQLDFFSEVAHRIELGLSPVVPAIYKLSYPIV